MEHKGFALVTMGGIMLRLSPPSGELPDMMKSFCTEYGVRAVATTQRTVQSPKKHTFTSTIYDAVTDRLYTEPPYRDIDVIDRIIRAHHSSEAQSEMNR